MKDKQVNNWNKNINQFDYDASNGDIKVLNSQQIRFRAQQVKCHTHKRSIKSKMTRLINQTKYNPFMYRVNNLWYKNGTYGKETKTRSYWNNNQSLKIALQGQNLIHFAKIYNKYSAEKIITAKQAHVHVNDGGNKIGEATYIRYPKVASKAYDSGINDKYNNGLQDTINYVIHNYPTKIKSQVHQFKINLQNINKDLKFNKINKQMKSAKRYSKRHDISIKNAYAQKYGIGNDQIDIGPQEKLETPFKDGLNKYRKDSKFYHQMLMSNPFTAKFEMKRQLNLQRNTLLHNHAFSNKINHNQQPQQISQIHGQGRIKHTENIHQQQGFQR